MEYKKAGVDISGAQVVKSRIKKLVPRIGHFAGLYDLGDGKVLVASVDGVGTKIEIARDTGQWQTVGIDIVNHCVNDILCLGAKPLFFLDYIAQDQLRGEEVIQMIEGMVLACRQAGIQLLGGETAQMPGIYLENKSDLAGMIVGIVEKEKIIDGSRIIPGDVILGLQSSGLHTNGYSLVRKLYSATEIRQDSQLSESLLQPHRSYLRAVSLLLDKRFPIFGIAHITGGGLAGNIPRILPDGCQAHIHIGSWPVSSVFQYIQKEGNISTKAMYQVFNMGIGMVLVVSRETSEAIYRTLWDNQEPCYLIGEIVAGEKGVKFYTKDSD